MADRLLFSASVHGRRSRFHPQHRETVVHLLPGSLAPDVCRFEVGQGRLQRCVPQPFLQRPRTHSGCFDPNLLIKAPHPRAGLAKVLGLDPASSDHVMNLGLQVLMDEIPGSDLMSMETICCSYKNLWKGKRYPGYYQDDTADQLTSAEEWAALASPGFEWVKLWGIFRTAFPQASSEVQAHRLKVFRDSGQL